MLIIEIYTYLLELYVRDIYPSENRILLLTHSTLNKELMYYFWLNLLLYRNFYINYKYSDDSDFIIWLSNSSEKYNKIFYRAAYFVSCIIKEISM